MPRLPDDRLNTAVYFYPTLKEAKNGAQSGGTGFWLSHPLPGFGDQELLCIVTNKHVAQTCNAVRLNRNDGKPPDCMKIEPENIYPHSGPHDLAIVLVPIDAAQTKFNGVPSRICITEANVKDHCVGIGDDVYLIGRFIGHEGKVHNEPTARFGNISATNRPMHNLEAGISEDSFAVETRSKPGYSGSGVFVYGTRATDVFKTGRAPNKVNFEFLLGVLWGQITEKRPLKDVDGKVVNGPHVTEASGLSAVVPAWYILELLEQSDLKERITVVAKELRKSLAKLKAGVEPMSANSASSPAPDSNRSDFNRLLGAAVKPPKSSGQT